MEKARAAMGGHRFMMMAAAQEGGAACPRCCGWSLCRDAAWPVCDAHSDAFTDRTLKTSLLGLWCDG